MLVCHLKKIKVYQQTLISTSGFVYELRGGNTEVTASLKSPFISVENTNCVTLYYWIEGTENATLEGMYSSGKATYIGMKMSLLYYLVFFFSNVYARESRQSVSLSHCCPWVWYKWTCMYNMLKKWPFTNAVYRDIAHKCNLNMFYGHLYINVLHFVFQNLRKENYHLIFSCINFMPLLFWTVLIKNEIGVTVSDDMQLMKMAQPGWRVIQIGLYRFYGEHLKVHVVLTLLVTV